MQTALAGGTDTLVTDNTTDFPSGEERRGILFLDSASFLAFLYASYLWKRSAVFVGSNAHMAAECSLRLCWLERAAAGAQPLYPWLPSIGLAATY